MQLGAANRTAAEQLAAQRQAEAMQAAMAEAAAELARCARQKATVEVPLSAVCRWPWPQAVFVLSSRASFAATWR